MSTLTATALHIADTQIGITEHPLGSNAGPDVEKYLKSVGLGKGYSWCMAFVYWCTAAAALKINAPNPLIKTGGVLKQFAALKAAGKIVSSPQPGDIFFQDHGGGLGHTGWVVSVDITNKTIGTIEGNSDASGSRTGGMVCRNPARKISSCKGFGRL